MSLPEGRFTITFNGEIYNFRELRTELEEKGVVFTTGTDTEVILRMYENQGAAALGNLRGMYVLAIWDAAEQSCLIARDPLGIKPLYFSESDGRLSFASELRALQQAGLTSRKIDPHALADYFETGSVAEPDTLIKGTRCLKPGSHLLWKNGRWQQKFHWEFKVASENNMSDGDAVSLLRSALLETVQRHFVSDVPVGIFLSGGMDSTALLALASETGHSNLSTFSIGVDDEELDESSIARRTAKHFGSRHHDLRLDESIGKSLFEEFVSHIDQPSIDGFNTYTVSKLAREHGMKVVLSGLGSDELLGGYPSFVKAPQLVRLSRILGMTPFLRKGLGFFMEHKLPSSRLRRIGTFLQSDPAVATAMRAVRSIFSRQDAVRLAAMHTGDYDYSIHRNPRMPLRVLPTCLDEVSRHEVMHYMRNQLLKDSDVMSMAHGLELRVPFVDHTFVDTITKIPSRLRLRPGKKLLVEAVPEVPEWVINQPKRGFLFPYQKWAESTWGGLFDKYRQLLGVPNPTWYQLWSKFMLDRWIERRGLESHCEHLPSCAFSL
jgi:asparagine synthase (glutamine-hydrolysing)